MSRIGTRAINVPDGVDITVSGRDITVKGKKGQLDWVLPEGIQVEQDGQELRVTRERDHREARAFHGLSRALIANMVHGVSEGFSRTLKIEGVGYRAALKGKALELSVGYSHPVSYPVPEGITIDVPDQTTIRISGIDKQKVGQVAAEIRKVRPPEPYKGKGIRYEDERVRRKAGKAAA
ncbi:MAG: 50S ribosomal protein L6 [Candidatus Dadabacteria bacterium]|nr:MAG: 50S ribosomal protein L6 [Candidatus Dadabacteria bacterium]